MAPTCAACLQPIVRGQSIKIVDHEVVHTTCIGRETYSRSLARRTVTAESATAAARAGEASARGELTRLALERDRIQRDLQRTESALNLATSQRDAAVAQATTAKRERDQLQRELSLARQQGATEPESPHDDRDNMTVRCGLLELD